MGWKPRTLGDDADRPDARVRCECGRRVTADMMVDASGLPAGLRRAAACRTPGPVRDTPPPYLCDGCREWIALSGRLGREEMVAAYGAPPEVLARRAARREAQQL